MSWKPDISEGNHSGIDVRAYPDGLCISGWYDSMVGIEPLFLTWEKVDQLKRKGRRRIAWSELAKP